MQEKENRPGAFIFGTKQRLDFDSMPLSREQLLHVVTDTEINLVNLTEDYMIRFESDLIDYVESEASVFDNTYISEEPNPQALVSSEALVHIEKSQAFYDGALLGYLIIYEYCEQTGNKMPVFDFSHREEFPRTITRAYYSQPLALEFNEEDLAVGDPDYHWLISQFETTVAKVGYSREFYAGAGFMRTLIIYADEVEKLNQLAGGRSDESGRTIDIDSPNSLRLRDIILAVGKVGKSAIAAYLGRRKYRRQL